MAVDKRISYEDIKDASIEVEGEIPQDVVLNEEVETVDFEEDSTGAMVPSQPELPPVNFNSNLADYLTDQDLDMMSIELLGDIADDKTSREDYYETYVKGLDLLGFKLEERTRPFRGASSVTHPVLAEAVTQFQAQAYRELLPAGGPVKTKIMGTPTPEVEEQADRVKDFMNYQITTVMKDYDPETDQMLFYLPLAGSTFKKIYYDAVLQRAKSEFVPAEDLIVPYHASNLEQAERVTHVIKMNGIELEKKKALGLYRDVELQPYDDTSNVQDKYDQIDGAKATAYKSDEYTLFECHCYLDIPGFEDPNGMKLPYIVTVDEGSGKVLSVYRNYDQQDPLKKKKDYFVHYKFLPGLGFYGYGLIHMIGGLSKTATLALRQLLDAGTLSNLPAGFKTRGLRIRDDDQPLQPGEFRDVDAPGGTIQGSLINLPYKGPDQTLFQLLNFCVGAAKNFVSVADAKIADMGSNNPVGSTIAMLERGSQVMSSIHKRLHYAQKEEFQLLAQVFKLFLPPVYPYATSGGNMMVKVSDFDDRVDVVPVSDPNIFSMAQRVALAQQQLQLAQSNPQIHNLREAYRRMYQALNIQNIDQILPPPPQPTPQDPGTENANSLRSLPIQVFPGQNHKAHIEAHRFFMSSALIKSNPAILGVLQAHISDHISSMVREEVNAQIESNIQGQIQQLGRQLQPQEIQAIQMEAENQIAQKIAEETAKLVVEEQLTIEGAGEDPLLKLKERELELREMEILRKAQEDQDQKELDSMRLMQKDKIDEEKVRISQERNDINAAKVNRNGR